jgi:hypothetical protein
MSDPTLRPSPASHLLVAAAWLAVGLPAAWGVYRTAVNAAPLFRGTSTHAPTVTAPAAKP